MKQTRVIEKDSGIHMAAISQVEKTQKYGVVHAHEYQGHKWQIIDAFEKDANHIVLVLSDEFTI